MTTEKGLKIADNQFAAVIYALEYLDARVGPYPWPHLTFVDPPVSGSGAGGMEYTTLFTSSGGGMVPSFFKMAEMVTLHEFGHAYFMGILASNEFEEPWLDEGVNFVLGTAYSRCFLRRRLWIDQTAIREAVRY